MASSKAVASTSLLLCVNLILWSMVGASSYDTSPAKTNVKCGIDVLKLGVCANLLGGLAKVKVGSVPTHPCCSLIKGLVDVEAAVCVCTAIKANVLNILDLKVPVALNLILNNCGKNKHNTHFEC